MKTNRLGVIVARFQVPELHAGHRHLIDFVRQRHDQVLVVLGCTVARLTERNPLDYETRRLAVHAIYPEVSICGLSDTRSDARWSANLDQLIEEQFPGSAAVLYGSRESCLSQYTGQHEIYEVPRIPDISATAVRREITAPRGTVDFCHGVIYAAQQKYPTSYQVVDVAVLNADRTKVLLGQKVDDEGRWRFLGGFVDPSDRSLEAAAKREVSEESSRVETDDYRYLGSLRVEDWRYPSGEKDTILTAFFVATFIFGAPQAADDIIKLEWRPIDALVESLVPEHQALAALLLNYLATTNNGRNPDHAHA